MKLHKNEFQFHKGSIKTSQIIIDARLTFVSIPQRFD